MSKFFVSVNVNKQVEPVKSEETTTDNPTALAPGYPYYQESISVNREVEAENEAEAVKQVLDTFSKLA